LASTRFSIKFGGVLMMLAGSATVLSAQYLGYPTAGVPKGPDGKPNMAAPAPRTSDGHPDFTGMYGWVTRANCGAKCNDTQIPAEFINIASSLKSRALPLKPEALAIQKARAAEQGSDPNVHCMPRGAPRMWTDDYYKRIIQTPEKLILLNERNMAWRMIFLDGRPLPVDPNPTWNGYSTGHWEEDTLVIQTIGFKDGLWLDASGNPLDSTGKMTERITRPSFGLLKAEITIDDPKSYTMPWTVTIDQPLVLDSELLDYYCLENERDFVHMSGK